MHWHFVDARFRNLNYNVLGKYYTKSWAKFYPTQNLAKLFYFQYYYSKRIILHQDLIYTNEVIFLCTYQYLSELIQSLTHKSCKNEIITIFIRVCLNAASTMESWQIIYNQMITSSWCCNLQFKTTTLPITPAK